MTNNMTLTARFVCGKCRKKVLVEHVAEIYPGYSDAIFTVEASITCFYCGHINRFIKEYGEWVREHDDK